MQDTIEKYEVLKKLGKELFSQSDVVRRINVTSKDIEIAKQFLAKAITATNPEVLSLYFEHVIIAPELGRRIVQKLGDRSYELGVKWEEIEFLLWLHEIGRLVDPAGYLRNDLIEEQLLKDFGIPTRLIDQLPPIKTMIKVAKMLNLSETQSKGEAELTVEQQKIASDYFNLLTPIERLVFFADNFGKLDQNGRLFDFESFINYLRTYGSNYPESEFAVEIKSSIILTIFIIEKIIEWLATLSVDFAEILKGLTDYGPKFVIVARHGIFLNPSGLIYNTDSVMKKYNKEIIHLSPKGKEQELQLGALIHKRKFRVRQIISSPSARAFESAESLNETFGLSKVQASKELDDVYMPGPVAEGMTMKQHEKMGGGSGYDESRWGPYQHEKPQHIIQRIEEMFWQLGASLKTGETGILISHGDPIAWWINHKVMGTIPDPKRLRNLIYPNKGDAIVGIIDPQGRFFSHYLLKDPSLIEGESF
ncbi:phosphoglycerate mutase family protein [Candidatus Roizmanbacteria bacterium]|nr:phosphoglycerate mutase family protein [Candidatus Roizmanbacteria bacterium]